MTMSLYQLINMNFLYERADIYDKIKVLFTSLLPLEQGDQDYNAEKDFFFNVMKRLDSSPYKKTFLKLLTLLRDTS